MATKKKTTTKKASRSSAKPAAKKRPATKAAASKRPAKQPTANQLRRTYKGQEIVVDIVNGEYHYDGQTFKSISGLARHIVGYQISGPVFFKLAGAKTAEEA